jgi:hypothetical protein
VRGEAYSPCHYHAARLQFERGTNAPERAENGAMRVAVTDLIGSVALELLVRAWGDSARQRG